MRQILPALMAGLLLSVPALAAEPSDDEILSDLFQVTAAPRPADVKMVVQTAKPAEARAERKSDAPAQDAIAPAVIKTAAK